MKKYTEIELQEMANRLYFSKGSGVESMIATEDGMFFYPHAVGAAESHGRGGKIYVINKGGVAKPQKSSKKESSKKAKTEAAPKTDKELIEAIKGCNSDKELYSLNEMYSLSNHKSENVRSAFKNKEDAFL